MRAEFDGAGLVSRRTPSGHRHIIMDYWVKPERTPAWAAHMKKLMGERKFNREFRRDWDSSEGEPYYPEWQSVEKDRRVVPFPGVVKKYPVLRFWDCGFRYPGCLWAQYSPTQNRLWVVREFMPSDIDAHSFVFLVMYLSGQIEEETFVATAPPLAMRWMDRLKDDKSPYPPPPWFSVDGIPVEFQDYAGPEATQIRNSIQAEAAQRTYAEVMGSLGIQLKTRYTRHKGRETVLRSLMRPRLDGYFGLLVDPVCDILIRGLNGGIAYEGPTKDKLYSDDCVKDGYFEHLHDALGYGAVQVVQHVETPVQTPRYRFGGPTGRTLTPVDPGAGESLGFNELGDAE